MHAVTPFTAAAAVSDERQPGEDMSWSVLAGFEDYAEDADHNTSDQEGAVTSEDWDLDHDFDEIDPSVPLLTFVREGECGRRVTACKKGLEWASVFRRVFQLMGTEEVLDGCMGV